jgi:microcystin-dependent protein
MMYSADNVTTCPIENTLGGTWTAIDSGNFLVAADDNVNSLYYHSKTGGSANTELISHTHTYTTHTEQTISGGEHKHMVAYKASKTGTGSWTGFEGNTGDSHKGYVIETTLDKNNYSSIASYDKTIAPGTQYYGDHTHTFTLPNIANTGTWNDGNGKNLPPYLAVYMWKRIS